MLGVGNDAQWKRFCGAIHSETLMNDPRFVTNADRVSNFNETVRVVGEVMQTRSTDEWLSLLRASGVPCSPINTLDQALEHPQVQSRALIVETDHPVLGTTKNVGYPVKFNHEPRDASRHAPLLGEHTKEVLIEMGLSTERIDALFEQGVVEQAKISR
jgi:formyl-CoA transferase